VSDTPATRLNKSNGTRAFSRIEAIKVVADIAIVDLFMDLSPSVTFFPVLR
jgi:hypothetical protein